MILRTRKRAIEALLQGVGGVVGIQFPPLFQTDQGTSEIHDVPISGNFFLCLCLPAHSVRFFHLCFVLYIFISRRRSTSVSLPHVCHVTLECTTPSVYKSLVPGVIARPPPPQGLQHAPLRGETFCRMPHAHTANNDTCKLPSCA